MEIHQILAGAAPGDAITNEALSLQRLLKKAVHSEVFAQNRDPHITRKVRHISEYERWVHSPSSHVMLIVHTSIAEPAVYDFLMHRRRERIVIRYHNITPAQYFEPYDAPFALLLHRGRVELEQLRDRACYALAVSRFNECELHEMGFTHTDVVPLLTTLDQLLTAQAKSETGDGEEDDEDEPAASAQKKRKKTQREEDEEVEPPLPNGVDDRPGVVFVGRIAPHKGHLQLLRAQHVLQTYHAPEARLYIAGGGGVGDYPAVVTAMARSLAVDAVFTGKLTPYQLATLYRNGDVLLCMSEHEGFCAPLVEAMAFGLPIVAWGSAAVPETLGDAGILLDAPDPTLAAAAVLRLMEDGALRAQLVRRGAERVRRFSPKQVEAAFLRKIMELAG